MGAREALATRERRAELPCATAARTTPCSRVSLGCASVPAPLLRAPGGCASGGEAAGTDRKARYHVHIACSRTRGTGARAPRTPR